MLTKLNSILIVLTLLAFTHADLIQPVTRTPVRPFSINQGYETDYSFSIYIPSAIPVNAYIEVEFPQPYQLSSGCKAYIKIGTGPFTIYSCSKPSYSKYLIYMGSIVSDEYTIVFEGVQNPSTHPASSNFKIKTYLNQIVLIDSNEFFDSVPFLAASGTSRNSTIKNIGYTSVSLGSSYDFSFALKTQLAKGDSIKFNFPEGFYFVKPACFHRNSGTYSQVEVLHNNRSVICQVFLDSMATGVFQVVSIIGVVNPEYAGVFRNFYLETLESTSANVYERISVPNFIQINPGLVTLSINSASNLLALNTTHQFELMFENDIPSTGEVWIKIPPGFRYLKANCTLLRPIEAQPNKEVTCELAANKTGYIIRGFTGISASQTITIEAVTENPPVATDYKIQVFSYSTTYNAKIDEAFGYITIINQYGASKFFASHSLRWTRRLRHNEAGPFEFTFFLNIPLPSTASTFYGKLIVDVRPQVQLPPAPKSLRCFFYNTIPAQDCTWDVTTNSDRTTITIMTPITDPYFQTEIPITVTTEDSVGTYGILLPMLIQRYKFYFYFWRNGDSKEHEVYFEDYVPEPIELTASDVTLGVYPLQYGQEAYMELTWTNNYYGLGTNYFIELEFDHSVAGWDYNLGFTALPFYGRYELPCLLVNSLNPLTTYKCYLNPGGSSTTNSTIQVLYIGAIPLNTVMTLRLPKIKLGTSGDAEIRFTLYENTPGENTLRIPIVFKDFFFTPNTATGLTASTVSFASLSAYEPDIDTTLTLQFTSTANNPRYIIYEYPTLFTIATQDIPCSGNRCYVFTSNEVHWIVFAVTSTQGTSAETILPIHNPPYIGSNLFKARTELSGPILDSKQGSVTIIPGVLTVSLALDTTYNPTETNKDSLVIFDLQTTTITNIPLDGSIKLTFTSLTVPYDADFACQVVSGLTGQTTAVDVICERMSATVIKLYNINAVAKNTALHFKIQLLTANPVATTSATSVLVESFYDRAASATRLIDNGSGSRTLTFTNINFQSSVIINDRSGDLVRADSYGVITLTLTPQHTANSQVSLVIAFDTGYTLSSANDVGYCKLTIGSNTPVRIRCTVSLSPLTFTLSPLSSTYVTAGVPMTIYLTTEYLNDPTVKGIKAPSTPGYTTVTMTLTDLSSTPVAFTEVNSQYIYVYPTPQPEFQVTGTCTSADMYTMFTFVFTLTQALNSNTDTTTRGRVYLEFPVGTGGFRDDLGTGQVNGGIVGCRTLVGGTLNANIKCRLVKSPGNSLPAGVELVGFGALTATTTLSVTVARVKHVSTTVGEMVFGLRIEHVTVATGAIIPREYAQYNLWHRVVSTTISTPYPTAPATTFAPFSFPNTAGTTMIPYIYSSIGLDSTSGVADTDYYIYEIPSDFLVSDTITCPSSITSSKCYSFPEIGWVVYEISGGNSIDANTADSTTIGTISTVTMPGGYSWNGYTYYAYIWKDNVFNNIMTHYIQQSYIVSSTVGTFTAGSITTVADQLVLNRKMTEVTVSFTTKSKIPSTGTIEIRFQSGVVPQPQCKNSPSMGSKLTSATGRVSCNIQSNSWLIMNFDAVAANADIRIFGYVNLPSSSGSYTVQIYSYSNQDSTNIATNGAPIDSLTTGLTISVQNYPTLSLDSMPSFLVNNPVVAKTSNYRPLIFDFTLNGLSLTGTSGTVQVTVLGSGTNFVTTLATDAVLTCSFLNPNTGDYIACAVSVTGTSFITYTLTPQENLAANTKYRGTITSVWAQNGADGIQHPSSAGTYRIALTATQGATIQRDLDFYEVLPSKFSSLTIKNYVLAPGEEDVIDISLTTAASVATTDRIVIELPTVYNSTTLFANDLGLSLIDYQDKLCEVITPASGFTMSCYFQKGNSYAGTPASIVLYSFSATFTTLRFAFTAKNPSVSTPTAIPLTIYTLSGTSPSLSKTYYQTVERAIIVLPSGLMTNPSNGGQPTYTPTTVQSTTATLALTLTFSSNLDVNDYYALKVPQMATSAPVYSATGSSGIISGVNADIIILPKNRFIILRPNTAVSSGVSVSISNLYNPEQGLSGSTGNSFTGYASHFGTMTVEKITYTSNAADFTGLTSLASAATIALSTSETSQNSILTLTIPAIYRGIKSVIIKVPSELTLREDCYEAYSNQIETYECRTGSGYVYVTLEDKTYSASSQNLILTILTTNSASTGSVSTFEFYLYTTTETNPTNLLGQRYAVTSVSSGLTLATSGTNVASPTSVEAEYVPYVENNIYYPTSTYGQLVFKAAIPAAITTSTTFKLNLPSSLAFDTLTTAGDLVLTPAVILYEPNDLNPDYVLIPATYAAGVLSFTSTVAISSSRVVTFTVTTMMQTGETVGIRVPTSSYSATFSNVVLEYSNPAYTAQIGDLTLTQAPTTSVLAATLVTMTKAGSAVTAWEFTITGTSLTTSINNLYIDLPTIDDFGNSLFDTGLGVFTLDESIVPCSSTSKLASLTTPECIFYMGTTSRPARILVRGFSASSTMTLYIGGIKNPAANRRVYMNIRLYAGDVFQSMVNVAGYLTDSTTIATPGPDPSYAVSGPLAYLWGTWTFSTSLTIPASTMVLVKLDSDCTIGELSGSQHFLTGTIGNYVLQKTSGSSYTFTNFMCTSTSLIFYAYNTAASSGEERRTDYSTSTRNSDAAFTVTNVEAKVSSNLYSQNAYAKLSFDISSMVTKFTRSSTSVNYLAPGFVITISFTGYYFSTIYNCQIVDGLTRISPNNPVQCSASGTTITITNFAGVRSGAYLKMQLSYGATNSYGSNTVVFNVFGSSTLQNSDYSGYASLSLTNADSSYAGFSSLFTYNGGDLSFATPPYAGKTGYTEVSIDKTQFPSISYATSSNLDYIRIGFEKGMITSFGSVCSVNSNSGWYPGCFTQSGSGMFDYVYITLVNSQTFPTDFVSTSIDVPITWPTDARNYHYDVSIVRYNGASYDLVYRSISVAGDIDSVNYMSASTSQLHFHGSTANEISYTVNNIPMDINPATTLLSFTYSSMTVQANHLTQIDCACSASAKCYNYNSGSDKSIDVVFDSTQPAGTSLVCYIPNLLQTGTESPDHRIIDAASRLGYFTSDGTTLSLTGSSVPASGTHNLLLTYPSSPILPSPSQSVQIQISSGPAYNFGDMAYIDFGTGGPLYTCASISTCRFYSAVRTILVIQIGSQSAGTTFDVVNTNLQFNYRHSDVDANYTVNSYVIDGQIIQSRDTDSLTAATFSPEQTTVTHSIVDGQTKYGLLALQRLSFTTQTYAIPAVNSADVGGRIIISVTGIGNVPTTLCYASYGNTAYAKIPMKCTISGSGPYTLELRHTSDIPASTTVEVLFRGTNPTSGTATITVKGYSYYNSANTNYAVKILQNQAMIAANMPTYTTNAGTYVDVSNLGSLSYITKTINPTNAPIRLKFKLTQSIPATSGKVNLQLPAGQYSYTGSYYGFFRTYSTDFAYTQTEASTITLSGTTFTVQPSTTLAANTLHEVIITTDGTTPHFAKLSAANTMPVSFENAGGIINKETINLYVYQATPRITLEKLYYTSKYASEVNTLVLNMKANSATTIFATSTIEIEMPSASSTLIKSTLTATSRQLTCGISGISIRGTSTAAAPKCIIVQGTKPKIRIENYAIIASSTTFNVVLYDLSNSIIPQDDVAYLDLVVKYTDWNTKYRSQQKVTRAFTAISGTSPGTTTALSAPTMSSVNYGDSTTMTISVTWPTGQTCSNTNCRIIIKSSGTDWKFTDATNFQFKIGTATPATQPIILDLANNAFVCIPTSLTLTAGNTYNFVLTSGSTTFINPLPYQNNGDTFTMYFSVSNHIAGTRTLSLTSTYTALTPTTLTGTTGSCTPFNSLLTGVNGSPGGNVECSIGIQLLSGYSSSSSITSFQIDFPTTSEYTKIHPYCEAYVSSGTATTPAGKLSCSRLDASASSASIRVAGYGFVTSSYITVLFRARATGNALTVNVNQYVVSSSNVYSSVYRATGYSLSVSAAGSTSYNPMTLFQVQPFAPTQLVIASPGTKSPLRIVTYIGATLTANSGYIQVTLGSGFALNGLTMPQCSLRLESTYDLPIITQCSYDSTNRIFTLTPAATISTTGRYLITIGSHQSDLTSDGVTFPTDTTRVSAKVLIYSGSATYSIDMIYIANIANSFYRASISPQANVVGATSSQFQLNFQVSTSTAVGADTSTDERILVLEYPTPLYDYDLGASSVTYSADGITPYSNGVILPTYGASAIGASTIASLNYGPSTQNPQIIISGHGGLPTSYQSINLGLVKNPAAYKPLRVNMYVLSYPSGQAYPTVLHQASYTNYDYTRVTAGETGGTTIWSFSNGYAQQATDITFSTKSYGTYDSNSKIYVKLKNMAKGFDYSAMTSITCTGYTVQWHKAGYIFYILMSTTSSAAPTITCTGFILGTTIEDVTIETGIHRTGQYIYASSQTITMSILNPIPSSTNTLTRITGSNTRNSINRYTTTINTNAFYLKAGGYLVFEIPAGLAAVPGLSEYIYVAGLTDKNSGSSPTAIQATISSGYLLIQGYQDYKGLVTFTIFLKNVLGGNNALRLSMYDQQGKVVARSDQTVAVSTGTTDYTQGGSVVTWLTDAIDVWATEKFRMTFKLGVNNEYRSSSSSNFLITLPTGFALDAGYEICKYRLDTSTYWIRSPCTVSSQTVTVPLVQGFDVTAGSIVHVRLTTEDPDYALTGMDRPATTNIRQIFNIKTQNPYSGSNIEQIYYPFILYPDPTDLAFTNTWYTRGSGDDAVLEVRFTAPVSLPSTEFFQLDLVSHDEIAAVWSLDLGSGVTEKRVIGNCAEHPDYDSISTSTNDLIGCYSERGRTASYYPSKLVVRNELTISSSSIVRYLAAKVTNPSGGIPGGFVISVMTPCRFDNYGCPRYRLRSWKSFAGYTPKTASTTGRAVPAAASNDLLENDVLTTFTFDLNDNVATTEAIVVRTNTANIVIQNTCQAPGLNRCIHFPVIGWTWYQPSPTLTAGTGQSIQFQIDNADYYDRTNPNDLFIDTCVSGGIRQRIRSPHPAYDVKIPALATFPTQTDFNNPYIVRNFDNIIRIAISNIWRTQRVLKIVVNTPGSYLTLPTSNYCQAGIDLADVGDPKFYEFPCQITADRQITFWIYEPTRWTSTYASEDVYVYFRGFLPVDYMTGLTTASIITSYCDLTQPYVLDENTNYQFTISPTPTPIIRDVNLNLKSVNDRISRINDYVMFYAAIWPNTVYGAAGPITQLLFEVDDEYAYPSLANLICVTKVVFKIQVSCTLKRRQGRTQIYVDPPPNYQHSPFLLTITNSAENLLFIAPSREGSFLFNVTYLDAAGNQVEKADSYMGINGEFVQVFSAEPIRRDPDIKTLYDIQFTTATRVTPQGFAQTGQTVYTQIVLLFQTYSPAYPLDLGSGLADGSEMSCVAVTGLTFNEKKKLTCQLIYGLPTDHSLVVITGYDAIPAGTSVRIFIDDITTMALGVTSRIKLEVRSYYSGSDEAFVFYNSLVVSPQTPTTSTAANNAVWSVDRATGASSVLRERTTYTVTFTLTNAVAAGDYLIFDFPSYGYELESDYSNVVVVFQSSSYPCNSWVMPKTNRIYIQPLANLPASTSLKFDITNIQNPSFYLSGSYTFALKAIVSEKLIDNYSDSFTLTSTVCTLFSNEEITYNSSYIRMNENTYQISFSVDHDVPAAGSVAILFDPTKYNLRPSNPTCELVSGFSSQALCEFELFIQPLVRIKMNGQALSAGTFVSVNVINVNNPTDNSAAPTITLQSYFDSDFGTTNTICSKPITLPAFYSLSAIKCPITIEPEINNADTVTDYIITLECSGDIRNATVVDIQFPTEFKDSFPSSLSCSTNGNYMLDQCSLVARTTRVTVLVSKPSAQQPLEIRIRDIKNPLAQKTYTTTVVNLLQYGVSYGAIDSATSDIDITIISNTNLVKSDGKLTLSIFPKNYGEKATYFFSLPGINVKQVPTDLLLDFDTSFPRNLGDTLECGTFTPDSTFGKSYALNYETLKDYKGFACELVDDYKLKFTLSPTFTLQANKPYTLFFYVQGIINPSINAQTSYSFNFLLTTSGSAVFSSQNTVPIAFGLPPSLLQIKTFTTSDSNILAPATYNFTLQASTALPASTTTTIKEYELEVTLPSTLYPDFQQNVEVVYSFPDNPTIQSGSSAFNYQNALFFSASYPNLQTLGAFKLSISNLTNPSVESYCGLNADGVPVTFEAQYVSRQKGFVYGRSYPIADQQNCLPLGKSRDAIKVISPLYLRKGLIYSITLQVEEAASDLYLTPVSTFLTFEPKTVSFLNYQSRTVTLNVVVPSNVPKGEYLIQWKKKETGSHVNYLEVPDTRVIVVDETTSTSITPTPKVRVEVITYVWTGTSPRDVVVSLDIAPAEDLIVQIKSKIVDTKLKGSVDGTTYSQFPISLTFSKGVSSKKFYISATDGAKDNVLTYTTSGTNAKAYDSRIADTPFSIQTQTSSTGFQVLSIQEVEILENKASYLASLSNVGTMYYMAVIESSMTPTRDQIISGQLSGINSEFYNSGSVIIQKIEYASSYSAYINITGLASQTQYSVYFVARGSFGEYSDIKTFTFKTLKVSEGAIMLIPSLKNITVSTLLEALSIILPIDKSRLIFNGADEYPLPILNSSNQALGSQLNGYQITIAPDPNNNSPTPLEIANQMQTQAKQDELAALVPEFYAKAGVRVTPVKRIAPRVIVTPSISEVGYYGITVHAELIEVGKFYAIVTEKTTVGNVKPTSYQISKGLMANNEKLDERYYKVASTSLNGDGDVVFDELRDYTNYNVYITAGNDVPYDPVDILANSEVMQLDVQTLKNPNVGSYDQALNLYDSYYTKSANRIFELFWGTLLMLMAAILYI